jgi:hypothetical protein
MSTATVVASQSAEQLVCNVAGRAFRRIQVEPFDPDVFLIGAGRPVVWPVGQCYAQSKITGQWASGVDRRAG